MGLSVLALVAAAISALLCTAADGWSDNSSRTCLQMRVAQIQARLVPMARSANCILLATSDGQWVPSGKKPAPIVAAPEAGGCVMLWRDANADGIITASELTLIERNPSDNTLSVYQYPPDAPGADVVFDRTDADDSADAAAFKTLARTVRRTLGENVVAAAFTARGTGSKTFRQTLDYELTLADGNSRRIAAGTICLRATRSPSQ